jgi:hypothetical protein
MAHLPSWSGDLAGARTLESHLELHGDAGGANAATKSWPGMLKYFWPIKGHSGRVEYGRSLFLLRKSRPVTPEVAGSSPVSLARTRGQGEAAGVREINAAGLAYAAQLKSLKHCAGGARRAWPHDSLGPGGKGAEQTGFTPTKRPRNPRTEIERGASGWHAKQ